MKRVAPSKTSTHPRMVYDNRHAKDEAQRPSGGQRGLPRTHRIGRCARDPPRQAPEVRRVTTRHIKETVDLLARQLPDWGQPGAHERALVTVAAMVGSLVLARAVDEPALSDALRQAVLKYLAPR